jgi:hypothetical protein
MNTEGQIDFNKRIEELTNQYYSDNKKNTFFKSSQKMECATTVTNEIGIDALIQKTIYIIPNTNCVFMDYTVFKTYATPDNYNKIVGYILSLFDYCIANYGEYYAHVNLDSFTISSLERYKSIINIFIDNCLKKNSGYTFIINKINILNTPKSFDSIINSVKHFFNKDVYQKIVVCNEEDSKIKLDYYYNIRDQ